MTTFNLKSAIERGKMKHTPTQEQQQLAEKSLLPAGQIETTKSQPKSNSLNQQYHDDAADFVTGKINDQPKPEDYNLKPTSTNKPKPVFNLSTSLQRSKTPAPSTDTNEKPSSRTVLFGTGLTKKLAAKQETQLKQQSKEIEHETADEIIERQDAAELSVADQHSKSLQIAAKEIILDEYQSEALATLKHQRFGCLIGAAGTGKTTLEKRLIEEIRTTLISDDGALSMACVAFTGRAVQQTKRVLPIEYHPLCSTIHSFLAYMPVVEEFFDDESGEYKERKVFRPTYTKSNPLPHKLIFVDESGMVPVYLWNQLIEACPKARIVLIGDINQLPPVQGKSVLGFAMCAWPTYELLKIHRQAEDNPIIKNAHNILVGKFPQKDEKKFAILDMPDGSLKTQTKFIQYIKALHKKGLFDPFKDAIIVPKNVDNLGQQILNERLVTYFNPDAKREIITAGFGNKSFAVGDKVMLLQNDNERGLTNGMTGIIVNISLNANFNPARSYNYSSTQPDDIEADFTDFDKHLSFGEKTDEEADKKDDDPNQRAASHVVTVRFPIPDGSFEEVQFSTTGALGKIAHAYAFTCHKSQGGEYPTVIILCHYSDYRMLTREWLYTAVTRAQERVILCCNNRGLVQALHTQKIYGRTVQEKAQKFLALQGNEKIEPILPKPEDKDVNRTT